MTDDQRAAFEEWSAGVGAAFLALTRRVDAADRCITQVEHARTLNRRERREQMRVRPNLRTLEAEHDRAVEDLRTIAAEETDATRRSLARRVASMTSHLILSPDEQENPA